MDYGLISAKKLQSHSHIIHKLLANDNYEYVVLNPNDVGYFLKQRKFKGINVTTPYKETVLPYIDKLDPLAKRIGSVNTILNDNNVLYGYNTDYYGLKYTLNQAQIVLKDKTVIILGSGGVAKTARILALDLKAKEVFLVSRDKKECGICYQEIPYKKDNVILINATPVGSTPDLDKTLVDLKLFTSLESVVDLVYNPLRTRLVLNALDLKIKAIGGLEMLVAQAAYASSIFHYSTPNFMMIQSIKKILENRLYNIVLIGLSYSGKTVIAKELGRLLKRNVIDLDEYIQSKQNASPFLIITKLGEGHFRKVESEAIKELAIGNNNVIALGGGAVLNSENMDLIRANSLIVYVKRDYDKIIFDNTRPLAKNLDDLKALAKIRIPLYEKYADFTILNNTSVVDAANTIKGWYDENFSD